MATTRRPIPGLSTSEIETIRSSIASGRKPKVTFTASAGQIAGQVGQVVQLTDPSQSEEWLVVRFGGGGRDELPFSPTDLTPARRGRAATKAAGPAPTRQPARPAPASKPAGPTPAHQPTGAAPASKPAEPAPTHQPTGSAPASRAAPATTAVPHARKPAKRTTAAVRTARTKPPTSLTVTLAYDAGQWTVSAQQGGKTVAKPYPVRSAEALKMVTLLDVAGVHDAVAQIVTAELGEAQRRAEALRSELAEVEARLADLRGVS